MFVYISMTKGLPEMAEEGNELSVRKVLTKWFSICEVGWRPGKLIGFNFKSRGNQV